MPQAAKFFDPVLGIDLHLVVVPTLPAPVPLPHPFIGIVFDPLGLLIGAALGAVFGGGGPVLVNGLPVGNTGTECIAIPHFPMPPGVAFAPIDIPDNEGTVITGAKTVTMGGTSEGRFGSMVASCNFPINLPTSLCLAIPAGAPVDVGGPEAIDWLAAITRGIRTKWFFEYDWEHAEGYCIRTWGDGGIYDRRITYDKARHTTIVDDGRGGRTHYFGNAVGLVEREIDPTGVEKRYEWDPCGRKVAEIDGLGHRTEWGHDERGNVILERNALGEETRWSFNDLNLPRTVVDAEGSRWTLDYDARGKPVQSTDPLGHARRYHHDRRGQLKRIENELGQRFELLYDEGSNLAEIKDWEGGCSRYAWDGLGRLVSHIDPAGVESRFAWDACGRLTEIRFPDGGIERRAYDPEGNLVERVDVLGNVTRYRYGGLNKLVEQIDGEGYSVLYHHDVEEDLVGITNELGESYRIDVDLAGRVVREVGFDGRPLVFRYDRAGRCVEMMNGLQKLTKLVRDPLGRIVRKLVPGRPTPERPLPPPEEVVFGYDRRGDLVRAVNADAEVVFERDAIGRVAVERVGDMTIESRYDAAGRRALRRTAAGHVTGYDIDGNGLLQGLAVFPEAAWMDFDPTALYGGVRPERAPWSMRLTRDAAGAEIERRLPGGVVARWGHDGAGRPSVHQVERSGAEVVRREYEWRSDEQIAAIADARRGVTRYEHDRRSYLVAAHLPDGTTQHRMPDPAGNLFRTPERSDRVYGPGGVLQSADGVRHVHDADGNLIEKVLPDGQTWGYRWDGEGRLHEVLRPDGQVVAFAYDALGRRVRKTFDGQTTVYVWDGDDLVHEMRSGAVVTTWEFAPETFAPVAKIEGNRRYGAVTDHLGTPLALLDEAGEVVWKAQIDIHGAAQTDGMRASCPWRWPGQYEDEETGLYYNRFRYFDPATCRYMSVDPLGVTGGIALYEYTRNPLVLVDPFGLEACDKLTRRTRKLSTEELNHAFDRHAHEIFGRVTSRMNDFDAFAAIVDRARGSGLTFFSRVGSSETVAHLARVDGSYIVVHFFRSGADAGRLATVFRPNRRQLGSIFSVMSRSGP